MKNVIVVTVIFILFACMKKDYVEFVPVYLESDKLIQKIELLDEELKSNVEMVLLYYEEKYKIEDGKLYITKQLADNKELIWNYTNKAKDSIWLKKHKAIK